MTPAKPKPVGMGLRRPGERATAPIPDQAIRELEQRAEAVASKTPGLPPDPSPGEPSHVVPEVPETAAAPATPPTETPKERTAESTKKVQISAYLPAEVRDELRRAAVALAGPPHMETVTSIIERAVRTELERLRDEFGPFPETESRPRPGRRAG